MRDIGLGVVTTLAQTRLGEQVLAVRTILARLTLESGRDYLAHRQERDLLAGSKAGVLQKPGWQFKDALRPQSTNRNPKRAKAGTRFHHCPIGGNVSDINGELQKEGVDGLAGLHPHPVAHGEFLPAQESHGSRDMTVCHLDQA